MIGEKVTLNGDEWTIDSYAPWSDQYVYLTQQSKTEGMEDRKNLIVRPTAVVRRHLQLAR